MNYLLTGYCPPKLGISRSRVRIPPGPRLARDQGVAEEGALCDHSDIQGGDGGLWGVSQRPGTESHPHRKGHQQ